MVVWYHNIPQSNDTQLEWWHEVIASVALLAKKALKKIQNLKSAILRVVVVTRREDS